jgi:hypothetical protein
MAYAGWIALTINAGVAAVVASVLEPMFDAERRLGFPDAMFGALFWALCVLAAFEVLGYVKS